MAIFSAHRDHPLHATLRRLQEMRNSSKFSLDSILTDESHTFSRNKIFSTIQIIQNLVSATPEELVSIGGMNSINSALQQVLAELTTFLSDENPVHLDNAASVIDNNVLQGMWAFTPSAQPVMAEALPELLQAQHKFSMESVRQVADASDSLSAHLVELSEEGDILRAKLNDFTENAARERAEASAAVAKLEQSFSQAESIRQQSFDESLRVGATRVEELLDAIRGNTEALLSELEEKRNQAAQIVQVVGNIGATGNYKRIADSESKQANLFRWITLGIFGAGVFIAVATFVKFWGEPLNSETILAIFIRLLYAIVITTPAWYSARESARHRSNADRARLTELELASIGPFIELLPEDKKIEIRTGLTSQYFGKTIDPHVVSNPIDAAALTSALKGVADDIVKAVKSA